ncbi:MAG: hypothetical protein JWN07_182, partial [Hyphomicrobiales bacterium]|nr:hypothetical protein [Hyphomicrobiales bacterium]
MDAASLVAASNASPVIASAAKQSSGRAWGLH